MQIDIEDIKKIVVEAGQLALLYYGKVNQSLKADLSVVTEADAALENFFKLALSSLAPGYGYLGEETEETRPPDSGEPHYWIVDALDGSRAFSARMPLWTPAVCLMRNDRTVAGAAFNPITGELFWCDEEGPAYCNDEPLRPIFSADMKPNTFILGPTNHHRTFKIDFPGRIYCLGAPIYQLCLVAKGAAQAFFFDPAVNLWDLAFPSLMLERTGGRLVYASGQPVSLIDLMDRSQITEPIFAGGEEMTTFLRQQIIFLGRQNK